MVVLCLYHEAEEKAEKAKAAAMKKLRKIEEEEDDVEPSDVARGKQGQDAPHQVSELEHGPLFCELVRSSRGVLPHVSTHTRTVGFPFEIGSLAHTTNRPILGPCLMCDALHHSIRRCAVECGVRDRS